MIIQFFIYATLLFYSFQTVAFTPKNVSPLQPKPHEEVLEALSCRRNTSVRRSQSRLSGPKAIHQDQEGQVVEKDDIVPTLHNNKKSKFSQLMSGERIQSSTLVTSAKFNFTSQDFPQASTKKWSISWKKKGTLALDTNKKQSDILMTHYSCLIPDDDLTPSQSIENIVIHPIHDPIPKLHNKRELHYIPSLLSHDQVSLIVSLVKDLQEQQMKKTQCFVAVEDGVSQYHNYEDSEHNNKKKLSSLLNQILDERVVPTARNICNSSNIVVADALIRWYGENKEDTNESHDDDTFVEALAPHYDLSSYVSMIIPLNPEECDGGLYIQYGAGSNTRHDVSSSFDKIDDFNDEKRQQGPKGGGKMNRGDAILHRYDIMHGVKFKGGPRYSLVIWMADNIDSCTSKIAPWVQKEANEYNSVHAAFLSGMFAKDGLYGMEKSIDSAIKYWEWAAARGHALSQYSLSLLFMKLNCNKKSDKEKVVSLMKSSAMNGLDLAQHELGVIYKQGYFGVTKDAHEARKWFQAAASQGYARSIEMLLDENRW